MVSYHTINRFRVHLTTAAFLEECFIQFRSQLVQSQLIDNEAIYIDGTKLEADANKFSFVRRKSTEKYTQSLNEKPQLFYQELYEKEILPALKSEDDEVGLMVEQLIEARNYLENTITTTAKIEETSDPTKSSHLKRKRRKVKKHHCKIAQDCLPRREKYDHHLATFGTRNSFSKTDEDATFMRMKDDYMKNGQLKAG